MRSRNWPVVAAVLVGAAIATGVVVALVRSEVVAEAEVSTPYLPLFQAGLALAWWLPGAALAWWRPTLPFAWLALAASGAHAMASLVSGFAPDDVWAQWVVSWLIIVELPLIGAFVQLFPNGRPAPRWKSYLVISMVVGGLGLIAAAIESLPTVSSSLTDAAGAAAIPLLAFTAIGCVVPLVAQFRRSVEGERRAVGFVIVVLMASVVVPAAVAGGGETGEVFAQVFTAVNIAVVTIVILRNRIWGSAPMLRRSLNQAVNATDTERRRIRAELHDGVGAGLTSVRMKVDAARRLVDDRPERATEMLTLASAEIGTLVDDVRRMVEGIRPAVLDHLPVIDALSERAQELSASGSLSIHVDRIDDPGLTSAAENALYRIVTEAFNNVVRHAHATRCDVRFSTTADHLLAEITDDGDGSDPDEPDRYGVGLSSMAARANQVGGFLTARPLPNRGFCVAVTLPRTQLTRPATVPSIAAELVGGGSEFSSKLSLPVASEESQQCPSR